MGVDKLSPRQRSVALLVSNGDSNKQIAFKLGLAKITVDHHIAQAIRVMNVKNRVQLAVMIDREVNRT